MAKRPYTVLVETDTEQQNPLAIVRNAIEQRSDAANDEIGIESNGVVRHSTANRLESSTDPLKTSSNDLVAPVDYLQHRHTPVWDVYQKHFEVKLNATVEVAVSRTRPPRLVVVRQAAATISANRRILSRLMQQPNFAKCWEVFGSDDNPYLVCEYMNITLVHVVALPVFPTELELAAIAGQLTAGLAFLEKHTMRHKRLDLSGILMDREGRLKIAEPELCQIKRDSRSPSHNIHELGHMITYLATKNAGENHRIPPGRYSPDVIDFIGATSNTTAVDLCKDKLLIQDWHHSDLIPLEELSQVASRRFWGVPSVSAGDPV